MALSTVDLPEPLGPMIVVNAPAGMVNVEAATATREP
jgi:hypothetical protein